MTELPTPAGPLFDPPAPTGVEAARLEAEAAFAVANRHKAVLVIAGRSVDAEECRTLLEMIGLGTADILAARAAQADPTRKRNRTAA